MFFAYILWSDTLGKFYVGHTQDLGTRLEYHNRSNVKFTRMGVPWRLVHSEPFATRGEAMKREAAGSSSTTGEGRSLANRKSVQLSCQRTVAAFRAEPGAV